MVIYPASAKAVGDHGACVLAVLVVAAISLASAAAVLLLAAMLGSR